MKKVEVDNEKFKDYLLKNCNDIDFKVLTGLYSYYRSLSNVLTVEENPEALLSSYENNIYKVEEGIINEKEKLELELDKSKEVLKTCNNQMIKDYVDKKIKEIQGKIQSVNNDSSELINYIKREIVEIQILLNIDLTFYYDAYDLFVDKYNNINKNEMLISKGR